MLKTKEERGCPLRTDFGREGRYEVMCYVMTQDLLLRYDHYLGVNGYSKATCQKYKGDLQQIYNYLGGEMVDEETSRAYQC